MGRHDLTFNGGMQIKTDQKKFGNSSWYFDGSNDYVAVGDDEDTNFGTGDFTLECWIWLNGTTATDLVFGSPTLNQIYVQPYRTGARWDVIIGGVSHEFADSGIPTQQWFHFMLARSGGSIYLFRDGVQKDSAWSNASAVDGNGLYVGRHGSNYFNGYIDEVRISKGVARNIANFIPPGQAYVADPFTVLLCHCEGDMLGTGAHEFTAVGTPVMSTAAPNNNYGGSLQFNGSTDRISVPTSVDFEFDTRDFTIDWWEYRTASSVGISTVAREFTPTFSPFVVGYDSGSQLSVFMSNSGSSWDVANGESLGAITLNTWNHFAVVRRGTSFYAFKNGVQTATWTSGLALIASSNPLSIGGNYGSYYFPGKIAGLRLSKGIARWTSDFTPPNTPYSKPIGGIDGYTKLMLHMDGGNNSAIFTDSSITPKNITVNGAVQKNDKMMFGRSCTYFDGSSYLSIGDYDDFDFPGDFTVDFWMYGLSDVNTFWAGNNYAAGWSIQTQSGSAYFYINGAYSAITFAYPLNTWCHFAVVRSGSTVTIYRNGVAAGSFTNSANITSGSPLTVGRDSTIGSAFINGYVDEFRISKGIARWTTNFTPPTKPYDTPAVDGYTKLLLHMNGVNGGTQFPDAGVVGHTVTPAGTAQTSTTTYKFDGSSMLLDGDSDYIGILSSDSFAFSGDFTVDFFAKLTSLASTQCLFEIGDYSSNSGVLFQSQTANLYLYINGGTVKFTPTNPIVTGVWNHFAIVRVGSSLNLYFNGVSIASTTSSEITTANPIKIGAATYNSGEFVGGSIQEFRISNGIARWTANFAPPVRPYGS